MKDAIWFKNKKYGWGWTPANGAGWTAVLIYMIAVSLYPVLSRQGYFSFSTETFLVITAILTGTFIALCYKKGESPSWNWGDK